MKLWMPKTPLLAFLAIMVVPGSGQETQRKPARPAAPVSRSAAGWEAAGTLMEACSCSVPCPCNFGQGPSRDYCHTVYAYRLKSAHYGDIKLDGLAFGGGEGDKGAAGFLDVRATAAQKPALEMLAQAVFARGGASGSPRKFEWVRIVATDDAKVFHVQFGESGGFDADVLFGRDRSRPIIVENNTTWPVDRFIKGKTSRFLYDDALGNHLHFDGVNANIGDFRLSGEIGVQSTRSGQSTRLR